MATETVSEAPDVEDTIADDVALLAAFDGPIASAVGGGIAVGVPRQWRARRPASLLSLLRLANVIAVSAAVALVVRLTGSGDAGWLLLAAVPAILLLCAWAGVDRADQLGLARSTVDDLPRLAEVSGLFVLALMLFDSLLRGPGLSEWRLLTLWAASLVALVAGRAGARAIARCVFPTERCLVIADTADTGRVCERLEQGGGLQVVASMHLDEDDVAELVETTVIADLVSELEIQRIIVSAHATRGAADLIRITKAAAASVSLLPGGLELAGPTVEVDEINGVPLVGVKSFEVSRCGRIVKRGFDLLLTAAGLLVISPLLVVIALTIKLDSDGPVFFMQTRVGRAGERFRIIKFRSMVTDAEARKDALRPAARDGKGLFKMSDDPRVTRVGRFLRRSSFDELPQLFNVLRGDMSLVGPRPLIIEEDALIVGLDRSRLHLLPPGITGPWQVVRPRASREEMTEIDYRYAANWSLWLDLKILLRTVAHVARRRNI